LASWQVLGSSASAKDKSNEREQEKNNFILITGMFESGLARKLSKMYITVSLRRNLIIQRPIENFAEVPDRPFSKQGE
jgi:hypothetical protein